MEYGKPAGRIKPIENGQMFKMKYGDRIITKRFYGEKAFELAEKYRYTVSKRLNLLVNQITMKNCDIIHINLNQNKTMITDYIFLDLCKSNLLIYTKCGTKERIRMKINKKQTEFHCYITNKKKVYHINGDIFDNRICNLKF